MSQEKYSDHYCLKKSPFFILALVALTIYLALLGRNTWKYYDYIGKSDEFPRTMSLSGEGKVYAIPDIATVSLGLTIKNKTVSEAQAENTKKINKLHEELKKFNIPKEDISTTQYSVYPNYYWAKDKQILEGYNVHQTLEVKIRDFDIAPKVLELIGKLELNQVGGLNFIVEDVEKYKQDARIQAVKNVQEKARAIAQEAGVKLGKIVSFQEDSAPILPIYKSYASEVGGFGGDAPVVEGGSREIRIRVEISYEVL